MRIMIGNDGGTSDHNDTVDIVFQSVQKTVQQKKDGEIINTQVMDDLALWCKTLTVSSNKLSQLIFEAMEYVRSGLQANNNMCKERAAIWIQESLDIFESIKNACDAKSSESIRNGENSQSTMIDKINRNSVEKIFTMKDTAKKSIFSSIMGKEKDKYTDDD